MFFYSLNQLFNDLSVLYAPSLFPKGAFDMFTPITSRIPVEVLTTVLFECHLMTDPTQVDLGLAVNRHQRAYFANAVNHVGQGEVWNNLHEFSRRWNTPGDPLDSHFRHFWLQFDAVAARALIPSLSFGMPYDLATAQPDKPFDAKRAVFDFFCKNIAPCFLEKPLAPAIHEQVLRSIDQLPDEAEIAYISLMLSRNERYPRLLIIGLTPQTILDYLKDIGWPGDWSALERVLDRFGPQVDKTRIAVDIAEVVKPRLSIECEILPQRLKERSNWEPFLDSIVQESLCSPEKAAGILKWLGASIGQLPFQSAPTYLWRMIQHIKFVLPANMPVHAKAYLTWYTDTMMSKPE